jgi:hypothetical protein
VDAVNAQLDVMEEGADEGGDMNGKCASRATQCTTLATLFLDMELLADAWSFSCQAVELLETQIPHELRADAYDSSSISSADAVAHIANPDSAPILGPSVTSMPNDWRDCYAHANMVKIQSGSLYYDTLESLPELFKSVATAVMILSRRVLEIWSDNKSSSGYGVALTMAARISYKQSVLGPVFVDRAVDMLTEAIPLLIASCGEFSVEVGDAFYWLGESYFTKSICAISLFNREPKVMEMSVALSCLFAAERIFKICHGSVHKNVGMVLATIGVVLTKCERLQASERYYRLAHKTVEVTTGVDSVLTATALLGLTGVLTLQGKYDQEALDVCERVRVIYERTYGKEYDRTKKVETAMEFIKKEIANRSNAAL